MFLPPPCHWFMWSTMMWTTSTVWVGHMKASMSSHVSCTLGYKIECERRASSTESAIHTVMGRGHSNLCKAAFNVLPRFCANIVLYPDRILASIFILCHREARKSLAYYLCRTSSTHATTDMQLIKHAGEVVNGKGAEMRTKLLRSHVGSLATFPRRVPRQRKGSIQRLKQPESAEGVHGIKKSSMLLLLWMKAENKLVIGL